MNGRYLANGITLSRIAASLALLLTEPLSAWFYGLFVFCGLTDMADGFVARRFSGESRTGAILDSIADAVFVAASLYQLLPVLRLPLPLWIWTGVIALIKIVNIVSGLRRWRRLVMPHTIANKMTGALLFLLPLSLGFLDVRYAAALACAAATFAAVQEGYLIRTGKCRA